jgi:predicted RNA-binding protein
MAKTTEKVADAAGNVKPYVERAIRDEDVRDNVKAAFQAAREVYDELIGNRSVGTVATRVATDREIQDKLREAVDELREASQRVQGKKDHSGRNATLLMAGITLGVLFNPVTGPATRKWIADTMFGGDEFTYDAGTNGGNSAA